MKIRSANLKDALDIANVHVASWQVAYQDQLPQALIDSISVEKRKRMWEHVTQEADQTTFVAEQEKKIVAFANSGPCRDHDKDKSTTAELFCLYALKDVWGQGLAYALWQAILKDAQSKNYQHMTLWVLKGSKRAIRFYERQTFTADGPEKLEPYGEHKIYEQRYIKTIA